MLKLLHVHLEQSRPMPRIISTNSFHFHYNNFNFNYDKYVNARSLLSPTHNSNQYHISWARSIPSNKNSPSMNDARNHKASLLNIPIEFPSSLRNILGQTYLNWTRRNTWFLETCLLDNLFTF